MTTKFNNHLPAHISDQLQFLRRAAYLTGAPTDDAMTAIMNAGDYEAFDDDPQANYATGYLRGVADALGLPLEEVIELGDCDFADWEWPNHAAERAFRAAQQRDTKPIAIVGDVDMARDTRRIRESLALALEAAERQGYQTAWAHYRDAAAIFEDPALLHWPPDRVAGLARDFRTADRCISAGQLHLAAVAEEGFRREIARIRETPRGDARGHGDDHDGAGRGRGK